MKLLEKGGRDLLVGQYEGSMYKALMKIYPEHHWEPHMFPDRPLDEEDLNAPVYTGNKELESKNEQKDDDKGKV